VSEVFDALARERHAELVAGLHALADVLARHPWLPVPARTHLAVRARPDADPAAARAGVDVVAAALGTAAETCVGAYVAVADFGPVQFTAHAPAPGGQPDVDRLPRSPVDALAR
jgi:hypothetical protein